MAWTTPATVVTGDIITAAYGNTYVRDNTAYLKGLLDGTGSGTVTVPGKLSIANDAAFFLDKSGADPLLQWDTNDYMAYSRSGNHYSVVIGAALAFDIDANGKLTGIGFYDSGAFSAGAGVTTTLHTGWGANQPRFVWGYWGNGSGTITLPIAGFDAPAGASKFGNVDVASDAIEVINGSGSTHWFRVFAKR